MTTRQMWPVTMVIWILFLSNDYPIGSQHIKCVTNGARMRIKTMSRVMMTINLGDLLLSDQTMKTTTNSRQTFLTYLIHIYSCTHIWLQN